MASYKRLEMCCPRSDCPNKSLRSPAWIHGSCPQGWPGQQEPIEINDCLKLRCPTCGATFNLFDMVFDCRTAIPGNPHSKKKERTGRRHVSPNWKGVWDGIMAARTESLIKAPYNWWWNFTSNMDAAQQQ